MTRPAYDPAETYEFKTDAFPFTAAATVDANVTQIEGTDATDVLDARGITTANKAQTGDSYSLLGTLFNGITSVAQWLGLIAGKQVGNSTARTELRATGAGSGAYDETTDSLQAQRDNVGTAGAGLTAISKTGYALAATGLDLITSTEPTGRPTTFPGWIMWLVQRFRRSTKSATAIVVKTEAGVTVTTQAITSSGDDQTLGPPT